MEKQTRVPILSANPTLISLEIIIIFCTTAIYAIFVGRHVGPKEAETMDAVIETVGPVSDSILLIIISVAALFEIGGELMLRYTAVLAKTRAEGKAEGIVEGKAEGIVEGKAEGRAEVYKEWRADWERRRQEAQVKGIPFSEPPPPNPETNNHKP